MMQIFVNQALQTTPVWDQRPAVLPALHINIETYKGDRSAWMTAQDFEYLHLAVLSDSRLVGLVGNIYDGRTKSLVDAIVQERFEELERMGILQQIHDGWIFNASRAAQRYAVVLEALPQVVASATLSMVHTYAFYDVETDKLVGYGQDATSPIRYGPDGQRCEHMHVNVVEVDESAWK